MKKELKRQIKQDEFLSGIEQAWVWAAAHKRELRAGVTAAAAVAIVAGGLYFFLKRQDDAAREDFRRAQEIFQAPLSSDLEEGAAPAGPVFATARERYEKAKAAFDGFERRFPRHELALRARYYAGLSRAQLGEHEEAEELLSEVAASRDQATLEPALALLALGELHRSAERWDEAIDDYQRLLEDESGVIPRSQALMGLAASLEGANRLADARAAYLRLTREFPASVYAAEAGRRADELEFAG